MIDTTQKKSCCSPSRQGDGDAAPAMGPTEPARTSAPVFRSADIPAANAWLGTDTPQVDGDGEGPLRRKKLRPYRIGITTVTNGEFADFVDETGYVTEAERFGWSFVFWSDVPEAIKETHAVEGLEWWRRVDGADWRDIHGPGTSAQVWHPEHPVVHVSFNDAQAFARWAGGRLPSEAEWEHAARGGLKDTKFPWGDEEPDDQSHFPCNIWQGRFPRENTQADGYKSTAPARSFAPNGYGLYNMVGNVWEWTADAYRVNSLKKSVRRRVDAMRGYKVLKGGSFLCHRSYCYRYRIAARTGNSPDSTTPHQGFRVVW